MSPVRFEAPSCDKSELETGAAFTPRFNSDGLITAVTTDADDGTVLMVAFMNAEALALTLETGIAHYWSRSRNELWKKGETSGNLQRVSELRTDCDQDAIWLKVRVDGHAATCHTGKRSCFYRIASASPDGGAMLQDDGSPALFDPSKVY